MVNKINRYRKEQLSEEFLKARKHRKDLDLEWEGLTNTECDEAFRLLKESQAKKKQLEEN